MKHGFKSLGNILSKSQNDGLATFITDNGCIRIGKVSENCLQIYIARPDEKFKDTSFAVENLKFEQIDKIQEKDNCFLIRGKLFDCYLDRGNSNISFKDKKGNLILADEPGLGTQWHGDGFISYKSLNNRERFIGLGEKTGPLDKRGKTFVNRNTDLFGYSNSSDPIYASIPFYLGIHSNKMYGIFLDNTSYTQFDFGTSNNRFSSFSAPEGPLRYYFFYGNSVHNIVSAYTKLTGIYPLPPIWALGYQQCRYSYYPQQEVTTLAQTFTEKKIPIDLIYLDIHYMDEYKVFTWNPIHFNSPETMFANLEEKNIKLAIIMDPGIKVEKGYQPYDEGIKDDHFVKYIDGVRYEGEVWPGVCHFPDFTSDQVRTWWGNHVKDLYDQGLRGFWHDMNEPAVWGNQFPSCTVFEMDGDHAGFTSARNIYGMQMCRATIQGLEKVEERHFTLTRAAYSGSQRYTAIWTGDNTSNQEHLHMSASMIANLAMCGFPMAGSDVGGFVGECSPELYMRWISLAAFQPLFRGHTMINTKDAEPWSFGEEAEEVARNYIQLRYKFLPYWYSLFNAYITNHQPPIQNLAMLYPHDSLVYDKRFESQFMLGETLLISPGRIDQDFFELYLPKGNWHDFYSGKKYKGGEVHIIKENKHYLPIFVRESGMFICWSDPIFRATEYSDTLEIHLYGINKDSALLWYEDDGYSMEYKQGIYSERKIKFDSKRKKLSISKQKGEYNSTVSKIHLFIHNANKKTKFKIDSKAYKSKITNYNFVEPVTRFDPFYIPAKNDKILFGSFEIQLDVSTGEKVIEIITP